MSEIRVDTEKCEGCGACLPGCPYGAITMTGGVAVIGEACNLCGACLELCPTGALSRAGDEVIHQAGRMEGRRPEEHRDIWVYADHRRGKLAGVTLELLGEGRKLADHLGERLCTVLLGHGMEGTARELVAHGADVVYLADSPELEHFRDDPYVDVMAGLVVELRPAIVLFGATSTGRSLAPRLAARLRTGLTADCTELAIDPGTKLLMQTRPAFGGNIMATILCRDARPQMATVRPRVMKKAVRDDSRWGEIIPIPVNGKALHQRTRVLEFIEDLAETVNLEDAEIIVSGGRGLGDPKNFALVRELAGLLGGAVGASRAVVDAGWVPYSHQVGQTGKTVSPKVYIACGISGAVQHLAGMQSSDVIVAINNNPQARIFDVATYGIVGDVLEVLPALIAEIKRLRGEG